MFRHMLHSENFAGGVIVTATFILTLYLSVYVGWLGMVLVGLVGLIITNRIELYDGYAISGESYDTSQTWLLARQMKIRDKENEIQRKCRASALAKLKRQIYIANTGFIAMVALGFSMFMTHQL